jgi:hypothetical protein
MITDSDSDESVVIAPRRVTRQISSSSDSESGLPNNSLYDSDIEIESNEQGIDYDDEPEISAAFTEVFLDQDFENNPNPPQFEELP